MNKKRNQKSTIFRSGFLFLVFILLLWPGRANTGAMVDVMGYISPSGIPDTEGEATILGSGAFGSGIKVWHTPPDTTPSGWLIKRPETKEALWAPRTEGDKLKLQLARNAWPPPSGRTHETDCGFVDRYYLLEKKGVTCENWGGKNNGITIGDNTLASGSSHTKEKTGSMLFFNSETGECCESKELTIESRVAHHPCIRINTSSAELDVKNALSITLSDSENKRTYYFDDNRGLIGMDNGSPVNGNYVQNWTGDEVDPDEECEEISKEEEQPEARGEEVNVWNYLSETDGNRMQSREYFEAEVEDNKLTMYKKEDHSAWQLFKLQGDTIYHVEDTIWSTSYNEDVLCQNGKEALMRIYNGSGSTCENGSVQGEAPLGGKWAKKTMKAGDEVSQSYSIVGFDEKKYLEQDEEQCCQLSDPGLSGDLLHNLVLRYDGCLILPYGEVADKAAILTTGPPGGIGENWYLDDDQGWIGFDMGTTASGNYITKDSFEDESDEVEQIEKCWDIANAAPTSSSLSFFSSSYVKAHGRRRPDATHLYLPTKGHEGLINQARQATNEIPGLRPLIGGLPNPGWMPGEFRGEIPANLGDYQGEASAAGDRTSVRTSLILAVLANESSYNQFAGSSTYGKALCSNDICGSTKEKCSACSDCWWAREDPGIAFSNPHCPRKSAEQCQAFDHIWAEDSEVAGGAHKRYQKLTVPVSAPDVYRGVDHCGGAMGAAQAMPTSWEGYREKEVERLTGSPQVSPWNLDHAFTFAGVHLAQTYRITDECEKSGGAKSQTCLGEVCSVISYMGGHPDVAEETVKMANGIASEIGEHRCSGWGVGQVRAGDWQIPIKKGLLGINCDSACHAEIHNKAVFNAWDWWAPEGTTVYPALEGKVVGVGCSKSGGYGCRVVLEHKLRDDKGHTFTYKTLYAHLGDPHSNSCYNSGCASGFQAGKNCGVGIGDPFAALSVRQEVGPDTPLGTLKLNGCTTDIFHLHFEIRRNGVNIDPAAIYGRPSQY